MNLNKRTRRRMRMGYITGMLVLAIFFVYQLEYDLRSYYTEFIRKVHEHMTSSESDKSQPPQPVLVTAFSSDHYDEAQGLIRSIHRYLPRLRLIVYNIGLADSEVERLVKYCRCEVRTFGFSRYPSHVRNLTIYAFKPLCVSEVLAETGFIFWVDASVRFKSSRLTSLLAFARSAGFVAAEENNPISCLTHPSMFQFFNVTDVSLFRQRREVVATYFLLYSTPKIMHRLVAPWKRCAMEQRCIAPDGHLAADCHFDRSPDHCGCHRYDQSALGILVYHMQDDSLKIPWSMWRPFGDPPHNGYLGSSHGLSPMYDVIDLRRNQKDDYFPR